MQIGVLAVAGPSTLRMVGYDHLLSIEHEDGSAYWA
jgi:hypothetical protein